MLWYDYTIYLECDSCHTLLEMDEGSGRYVLDTDVAAEAKSRGWTFDREARRLSCPECHVKALEDWWRENAAPASRSSSCSS